MDGWNRSGFLTGNASRSSRDGRSDGRTDDDRPGMTNTSGFGAGENLRVGGGVVMAVEAVEGKEWNRADQSGLRFLLRACLVWSGPVFELTAAVVALSRGRGIGRFGTLCCILAILCVSLSVCFVGCDGRSLGGGGDGVSGLGSY